MVGGGEIHPRQARPLAASVVAFQAERENHRTAKQAAIRRSVGVMTSLAPFDHGGWVLIDEWPAPVAMAFQARLIVECSRFHHGRTRRHAPRGGECAVRVVTIPTIHEALVDAVFGRHFELRAHAGVTRQAGLAARLRQQKLRAGRMMNRVAIGAGHAVQGVPGPLDVGFLKILGVAREANFQGLLGWHQGEGVPDGRLAAAGRQVFLSRTMTAFATGLVRRPIAPRESLIVRILIEARPYVGVTGFTCVAAHVTGGCRWRLRRTKGRRK